MKTYIPEVSDEDLQYLDSQIKPIVSFNNKQYYIKKVDIKSMSYIWDPKKISKAKNLLPLQDITTYHRYGYRGIFKPSIAEVLAQIPRL